MYHPKHIHTWLQLAETMCLDIRRGLLGTSSKALLVLSSPASPWDAGRASAVSAVVFSALAQSVVGADCRGSSKRFCPIVPITQGPSTPCLPRCCSLLFLDPTILHFVLGSCESQGMDLPQLAMRAGYDQNSSNKMNN